MAYDVVEVVVVAVLVAYLREYFCFRLAPEMAYFKGVVRRFAKLYSGFVKAKLGRIFAKISKQENWQPFPDLSTRKGC